MKLKRIWAGVMLVMLICGMFPVNALAESHHGEVEYQFFVDGLSDEKKEQIIQSIAGINDTPSMGVNGLSCIFGHDLATGTTLKTTHNAYSTSPRCLEEMYSYEICQRADCGYSKTALLFSRRITCH